MICPNCNKPALMLFADGNCRKCQPLVRPHKKVAWFRGTVAQADLKKCQSCGEIILQDLCEFPSHYKRRKTCSHRCTVAMLAKIRNEWWKAQPRKKKTGGMAKEKICAAKREGVYTPS